MVEARDLRPLSERTIKETSDWVIRRYSLDGFRLGFARDGRDKPRFFRSNKLITRARLAHKNHVIPKRIRVGQMLDKLFADLGPGYARERLHLLDASGRVVRSDAKLMNLRKRTLRLS